MKYINTTFMASPELKKAYEKLYGFETGPQMYICVKAKGRKDAERICAENGLNVKFLPEYSSESGNEDTIAKCNSSKSGIVIDRLCGTKETEYTLEQIREVQK